MVVVTITPHIAHSRQWGKSQFIRLVLFVSAVLIYYLGNFPNASSVTNLTPDLVLVAKLQELQPEQIYQKIWAVYICNNLGKDDVQHKKITELHNVFGDKLAVITDQNCSDQLKQLSYYDRIVFDQKYTRRHLWNFKGYGLEKAMMWLIVNQAEFSHAWVIEEDVHWKDIATLQEFFKSYDNDDTDFLHQNMGMEDQQILSKDSEEWNWWNLIHLRPPHVTAKIGPPYFHGLFMFYRLSSCMTKKLDDWRLSNAGEWTFFEPLLSVLPVQDPNLTTKSYINNSVGYEFHLDYRPCFTKDDIYNQSSIYPNGDLFHPVKKRFEACSA